MFFHFSDLCCPGMTDFGGKTSCAVNWGMYMHSGFSQKSVLKPKIPYLDFEMVKSGTEGPAGLNPSWPRSGLKKENYISFLLLYGSFHLCWVWKPLIVIWQEPHFIYNLCSGIKMRKGTTRFRIAQLGAYSFCLPPS